MKFSQGHTTLGKKIENNDVAILLHFVVISISRDLIFFLNLNTDSQTLQISQFSVLLWTSDTIYTMYNTEEFEICREERTFKLFFFRNL